MNISVLGCGRWGSFLAWYLQKIGHNTTLWGRPGSANFAELDSTRRNEYVTLSPELRLTSDLAEAVLHADVIILSISAQALRSFLPDLLRAGGGEKTLVLCMKGIECTTGKRLSEVVTEFTHAPERLAVWVGPGHIQCFVQNIPNCMVLDSTNCALTEQLGDAFKSDLIKFYYGSDLIGSEIGAAAKNVVGIAAGMLDGAGYSTLKGALMARGAREVARLIRAMGGNELSAYGLCHLGDYETTLFSPYSNNKRFGEAWIRKEPFGKLAEGVMTAEGMLLLAKKYGADLPITQTVHNVVQEGRDPMKELLTLFSRPNTAEFY